MKAAVRSTFGGPEVVRIEEIAKPDLVDDGVLVRVRAASVNRADWYSLTGKPFIARTQMGLLKPKERQIGTDFAGTVEAVGNDVPDFRPGDEVVGGRTGAFSEYVVVRNWIARKPAHLSFEQAATLPTAGVTALQGLRDHGQLQPGQKVLINGGSGGVGIFAVQIAKAFGAEVTAVCSTPNVEQMRALGADAVIDYTRDDFTRLGQRFDLMLDVAGSRPWSQVKRILAPDARWVIIGAPKGDPFLGPLSHILKTRVAAVGSRQTVTFFIAKFNRTDFDLLGEMTKAGQLTPLFEKTYPLEETAKALRHMEGSVRSKIVITI